MGEPNVKAFLSDFLIILTFWWLVISAVFIGEVAARYFYPIQVNGVLQFLPPQPPTMQMPPSGEPPLMRQPPWGHYSEGTRLYL